MSAVPPSRSPRERALELLSRMTLDEKLHQMVGVLSVAVMGADGPTSDAMARTLSHGIGHIAGAPILGHQSPSHIAQHSNAIQRYLRDETRLGIPAIIHSEALNGAVLPQHPVFPTPIALAATWNPGGVHQMARMIAAQLRAVGVSQALAPVMDVARDARWGRVHETYGEDPYLVSALSVAFTKGLQGDNLETGVMGAAKHFLGYAVTEAGHNTSATVASNRDIYEVFARPFEAAMRTAGLGAVMNSYSSINNEPIVASPTVLRALLREKLEFTGTVISDYGAVQNLVDVQLTADGPGQAGAQALIGGLDVELPAPFGYSSELLALLESGEASVDLVDEAVLRILTDKFALGLFENPFVDVDAVAVGSPVSEGAQLADQLAKQSLTLLKNDGATLPLPKTATRIAVIGPHATDLHFAFPSYTYPESVNMMRALITGENANMAGLEATTDMFGPEAAAAMGAAMAPLLSTDPNEFVRDEYSSRSLAEAISELIPQAQVESLQTGVLDSEPTDIDAAVELASGADITILALGGRPGWFGVNITEGEASDTANIDLPGNQVQLVRAVAAAGKTVAAVVFTGRPFALRDVVGEIPAIMYAYYGGQRAGQSVAAALFGDVNPGGKLPYSLPRHSGQIPMYSGQHNGSGYRRSSPLNLGYLDMPATPLYPFGHGLSYTSFDYTNLTLSADRVDVRGSVTISCVLNNVGDVEGDEVVQLYFRDRADRITRPAQQLVGFSRVGLRADEQVRVDFTVQMAQLGYIGADGRFVLEPGDIAIEIGSSSDDIRLRGTFTVTGDTVEILGKERTFVSESRITVLD